MTTNSLASHIFAYVCFNPPSFSDTDLTNVDLHQANFSSLDQLLANGQPFLHLLNTMTKIAPDTARSTLYDKLDNYYAKYLQGNESYRPRVGESQHLSKRLYNSDKNQKTLAEFLSMVYRQMVDLVFDDEGRVLCLETRDFGKIMCHIRCEFNILSLRSIINIMIPFK